MLKHYTVTFTKDKETYITRVVPAKTLVEAYLAIQDNYPGAVITEAVEGNRVGESWAHMVAKYMIAHASLDEVCAFACYLTEEKHDEFINAIWDEWHNAKPTKAV